MSIKISSCDFGFLGESIVISCKFGNGFDLTLNAPDVLFLKDRIEATMCGVQEVGKVYDFKNGGSVTTWLNAVHLCDVAQENIEIMNWDLLKLRDWLVKEMK